MLVNNKNIPHYLQQVKHLHDQNFLFIRQSTSRDDELWLVADASDGLNQAKLTTICEKQF